MLRSGAVLLAVCRNLLLGSVLVAGVLFVLPLDEARAATEARRGTPDPRVLEEARQLLAANQAEQAYQLLALYEYEWAGDRDFDYLLGAAAVDSKRPGEGILSLQRVIAVDPNFAAARMELARAYYEIGDYDSAEQEFQELLQQNPPDYARKVINNYLAAINRRSPGAEERGRYGVSFDFGYDSNANGATNDSNFLIFTLDDRNVAKESGFVGISHGGVWTTPIDEETTNYFTFGMAHRRNLSATFVNYDRVGIGEAITWRRGPTEWTGGVSVFGTMLDTRFIPFDGDVNQYGYSFDFGTKIDLDAHWRVGGNLRGSTLWYAEEIAVRDVYQVIGSLTAEHFIPEWNQMIMALTLVGGEDDARQRTSPYGRDMLGGQYSVSWLLVPEARAQLFVGVLDSDFAGTFIGFERDDRQATAGLSVNWKVFRNPNWSLVPRLTYVSNESTVELFDYNRTEVAVAIRFWPD